MDRSYSVNPDIDQLRGRFMGELQQLCGGALEQLRVLPEMTRLAQTPALRRALIDYGETTRRQAERLTCLLAGLGQRAPSLPPPAGASRGPAGLSATVETDAVLIAAVRGWEHHALTRCLLALNYAQILREAWAADLLETTLQEEYAADETLAALPVAAPGGRPPAGAAEAG